jgi:putative tryptophan/tyrosine transport system substrate-binding protein
MKQILTGLALGAAVFALSRSAVAQQPTKVPRIGLLVASSFPAMSTRVEMFRHSLHEFRYEEGKNITINARYAGGKSDHLPTFVAEMVDLKVDLLVALGTPAIVAAKNVTNTIPIVMIAGDPVEVGLIDSLARPGGNITGITNLSHELSSKRLELLKETVPKASRVAVLWNSDGPGSTLGWKKSQLAGRDLGLQVHSMSVHHEDDFEGAFKEAVRTRSDALLQTGNVFFHANQSRITELAMKHRLPAIYERREFVEAGGLMSYAPNNAELFRRIAYFVSRILRGTKPGDLPVEQPTRFELVINLRAAQQIGITIPPDVLMWAEKVIK